MPVGVQWDRLHCQNRKKYWANSLMRPPRSSRQYANVFIVMLQYRLRNEVLYVLCDVSSLVTRRVFHIRSIIEQCSTYLIIHYLEVQIFHHVVLCLTVWLSDYRLVLNKILLALISCFVLELCACLVFKSQCSPLPVLFWWAQEVRYNCRTHGLHGLHGMNSALIL